MSPSCEDLKEETRVFDWVKDFDCLLLDFDGLLVNTEKLHYQAYHDMVCSLGFPFPIDYPTYCEGAHLSTEALRDLIYSKVPELKEQYPNWMEIRKIKIELYLNSLKTNQVKLMPGVKELLQATDHYHIPTCIVTNSPLEQIKLIQARLPELSLVTHVVSRESYTHSKPHPDGYLTALNTYFPSARKVIGFEDTIKGVQALIAANIEAVLIVEKEHPHAQLDLGHRYFPTFFDVSFA